MKKLKFLLLTGIICCMANSGIAQFKFGVSEVSVLASASQMGVPFVKLFPIHPGAEISATFLKKEKSKSTHRISGHAGYIHHDILIYAPYVKATYDYELKIKNTIGIDSYLGIGYAHAFYPGEGYRFNDSNQKYESKQLNQSFFLSNFGFGLNYLKPKKINPFLKYNVNYLGLDFFDFRYLISSLHLGVRVNLIKQ